MRKILTLLFIIYLPLFAGGSAGFKEDLLPLIKKNKHALTLLKEYDFNNAVWVEIRLGNHTNFAGIRLGPYTVIASSKDTALKYKVTFKTSFYVLDHENQKVAITDEQAVRIIEYISDFKIENIDD